MKQVTIFDHRLYPREPGYQKRDTSFRAARKARGRKLETHTRIVRLLRAESLTADEIAHLLGEDILYIRPRVAELAELAQVEDSNIRRFNKSGKSAIVWRVLEQREVKQKEE